MSDAALRPAFLALEGPDGAGKSSIRNILHAELVRRGHGCIIVGQHAWLDVATARIMINAREQRFQYPSGELVDAYFLDKNLHATQTIRPALEHASVIADRSFLSDAVYQEVLYGINAESTLRRYHENGALLPELIIWIEVDSEEAYRRVIARGGQARHYERPAPLREISRVYQRVLIDHAPPWLPPVIKYVNERHGDWRSVVKRDLLPQVCDALASRQGGGRTR
ncbi:dTMP kinase [Nonomuraea angiospora]|uniref:Thymidylate kinase n=1 Tax=Nonomuraea angiospora TaxID=46172 RepID=A0ABR9LQC6_9ACTN|nr:hypothetical protein [Nonomuraea angiospora]MBE1582296.1 thymidylate kinase [Nonomuraea angiospora]